MAWWSVLTSPLAGLFDMGKEVVKGWQERRTLKTQASVEVAKIEAQTVQATANAQLEMARNGQIITADWDRRAQEAAKTSWKDELLMIVFITPFVLAFIPKMQPYIKEGFAIVDDLPIWYRVVLLGIVAAVFGLRWLIVPLVGVIAKKKEETQP